MGKRKPIATAPQGAKTEGPAQLEDAIRALRMAMNETNVRPPLIAFNGMLYTLETEDADRYTAQPLTDALIAELP